MPKDTGYTDLGFLVENLKNISTEDAAGAVDNFNNKTALYEKFLLYKASAPDSKIAVMKVRASLKYGRVLLCYVKTGDHVISSPAISKIGDVASLFGQ